MNILLTSQGQYALMTQFFKNALGNNGKVYASNSIMTPALLVADEYVISPLIKDPSYIDFLLEYCQTKNITAIFSWFNLDLPVLSKNKELLKKHNITVVISDESVIQTCNDKWNSHLFLNSLGLKQPKTYIDIAQAKHDIKTGKLALPVILKPRWGENSSGVFQADTLEELDILYQKTHRIIFRSHMQHQSKGAENECVLIQEKIVGDEYGIDVLNDLEGNYVTTIAKLKIGRQEEGESIMAQVVSSEPFEYTGRCMGQHLKHITNLNCDCFLTSTGDVYVVDMNASIGSHYHFAHLAGADFPKQIIEWLMGRPTSLDNITPKIGVRGYKDLSLVSRF